MSLEGINKNKLAQPKEGKLDSSSKKKFKSFKPRFLNKESSTSHLRSKKVKQFSPQDKAKENFLNKNIKIPKGSSQRPVVSSENSHFKVKKTDKLEVKSFSKKYQQPRTDYQQKRKFLSRRKVKFFIPPFERRKFNVHLVCNLCNKTIGDPLNAFASPNDSERGCHFECVLNKIKSEVSLKKGESLVYVGSGCFAVVSIVQVNRRYQKVSIHNKIEFEKHRKDQMVSWRKELIQR